MKQRCHVCKTTDETKFASSQRTICMVCNRAYQKQWYQQNRKAHRKRVKDHKEKNIRIFHQRVGDFLFLHPCVDCGESDIRVLDFDHVEGNKRNEVTNLLKWGYTWEAILEEIKKCVVRCANCHRRRTLSNSWRNRFVPTVGAKILPPQYLQVEAL